MRILLIVQNILFVFENRFELINEEMILVEGEKHKREKSRRRKTAWSTITRTGTSFERSNCFSSRCFLCDGRTIWFVVDFSPVEKQTRPASKRVSSSLRYISSLRCARRFLSSARPLSTAGCHRGLSKQKNREDKQSEILSDQLLLPTYCMMTFCFVVFAFSFSFLVLV